MRAVDQTPTVGRAKKVCTLDNLQVLVPRGNTTSPDLAVESSGGLGAAICLDRKNSRQNRPQRSRQVPRICIISWAFSPLSWCNPDSTALYHGATPIPTPIPAIQLYERKGTRTDCHFSPMSPLP